MNYHICTLFEGHYHYGLGGLVNSLYVGGFRGTVWVGHRGPLPPWATNVREVGDTNVAELADGLRIVFLEQTTDNHFALHKPTFMLDLWDRHIPEEDALLYFDPDIVVRCRWSYFENWLRYGVGVVEDVNSPMSMNHPRRRLWQEYFAQYGTTLTPKDNYYLNSGFVGVPGAHRAFVEQWAQMIDWVREDVESTSQIKTGDPTYEFDIPDQDALNAVKDATSVPLSISDKDAMDLRPGGYVMSHAVGKHKPWLKRFLPYLLRWGHPPLAADRAFIRYVRHPIPVYGSFRYAVKRLDLVIAAILGRVIGK